MIESFIFIRRKSELVEKEIANLKPLKVDIWYIPLKIYNRVRKRCRRFNFDKRFAAVSDFEYEFQMVE